MKVWDFISRMFSWVNNQMGENLPNPCYRSYNDDNYKILPHLLVEYYVYLGFGEWSIEIS